ncbi:MFS transporter [Tissierella pigra]|uniref:MFS transporter n=1 Tax=Tissierella pigra TaxID=2607614 RepID=A0A6N7XWY5_9FIRM|nr:MFS transporter [Tissierella pigra]MBU5428107.1 MFS transporter [Tissierella pigra]MSU01963.1 MFS transporter [Tissierella pigra]
MNSKSSNQLGKFGKAGWGTIIYCAAMFWLYVGMVNDGSNITAPAFTEKMGIEYSTVLSMGTVAGLVGFIFFLIFGQVNRKIGARYTSGICMILSGVAYLGLGYSNSLVMYAICLCIVTGASMSAGYIAGGTLVAKWFPKKKGIVMGYTTMGHNLASAFYVPLISATVGSFGLSKGVVLPSIAAIFLGIIGIIFVRDTPEARGQLPDNVNREEYEREYHTDVVDEDGGWTTSKLLKTKELWLSAITTGMYQLVTVGIMTQLVVRNMQLGFTQSQAIGIMTVLACIGVVGSWGFGVIDQKWGTKNSMLIFGAWYVLALIANITEIKILVYISIFMIGMSIGGSANFTTSLPAAIFGRHGFEKVNSVVFPIQGLITALNFLLSGISIKLTGSLRGVYIINVFLILINMILINIIDEHRYNKDFQLNNEDLKFSNIVDDI